MNAFRFPAIATALALSAVRAKCDYCQPWRRPKPLRSSRQTHLDSIQINSAYRAELYSAFHLIEEKVETWGLVRCEIGLGNSSADESLKFGIGYWQKAGHILRYESVPARVNRPACLLGARRETQQP